MAESGQAGQYGPEMPRALGPPAAPSWPMIGRDEELKAVVAALDDPDCGGVALVGAAGVGKTRLGTEAAAERGLAVVAVRASRSASGIPLGALAPLFAELGIALGDSSTPFTEVATALEARPHGDRLIVVVDDAQELDDASAAVLDQIVGKPGIFLLLTVRAGSAALAHVVEMWKDGHIVRIQVDPLPDSDIRALVGAALGQVDGGTMRDLVRDFLLAGRLARHSWRAGGEIAAAVTLADSLDVVGQTEEAEEILREAYRLAPTDLDRTSLAARLASLLFVWSGRAAEAEQILVTAGVAVSDPTCRRVLDAQRGDLFLLCGDVARTIELDGPLLTAAAGEMPDVAWVQASRDMGVALALAGRSGEALGHTEAALSAHSTLEEPSKVAVFLSALLGQRGSARPAEDGGGGRGRPASRGSRRPGRRGPDVRPRGVRQGSGCRRAGYGGHGGGHVRDLRSDALRSPGGCARAAPVTRTGPAARGGRRGLPRRAAAPCVGRGTHAGAPRRRQPGAVVEEGAGSGVAGGLRRLQQGDRREALPLGADRGQPPAAGLHQARSARPCRSRGAPQLGSVPLNRCGRDTRAVRRRPSQARGQWPVSAFVTSLTGLEKIRAPA